MKINYTDTIEMQVREALVERQAQEMCSFIQEHQQIAMDIALAISNTFDKINSEDTRAVSESNLKIIISDPQLLKKTADKISLYNLTERELNSRLKNFYDSLKDDFETYNIKSRERIRMASLKLYSLVDIQNLKIMKLAEIAKNEGVDKALLEEAETDVTRKVFPTADEYISFAGGINNIEEYLVEIYSAMQMCDAADRPFNAGLSGLKKTAELVKELKSQVQRDVVCKKAQIIYGKSGGN